MARVGNDAENRAELNEALLVEPEVVEAEEIHKVPTLWVELKELSILSVPVAISTLARLVVINTDTAFVGHLDDGKLMLSAANFANTWNQFLSNIVFAPGYALNSLCSQAIGAGNNKLAGVWLQLALIVTTIICIPVLAGYVLTDLVVRPLVDNPKVAELAQEFNMVSILVLWPMVLYMILRQYFQAMQVVTPAMVVSCLTVGFNYLMNMIFVPMWGLKGSPFATFLSMLFQIGCFLLYTVVIKGYHKPYWGGFTWEAFDRSRISRFMKMVVPMAIGIILENSGLQLISFSTGHIGEENIAAHSILCSLWGVLWAAYWGIGLALQVRVGGYLGKGNAKAARQVAQISVLIVVIVCSLTGFVSYTFSDFIAKMFTTDVEVQKVVSSSMYALVLDYFFACMALCAVNMLEAMAQNKILAFTLGFGMWAVQVPCALLFAYSVPHYKEHPVEGIWMGQVCGELFKMFVLWGYIYTIDWNVMCKEAKERSEAEDATTEEVDAVLEHRLEDADLHFAAEVDNISPSRILGHETAEGLAAAQFARSPSPFVGTRSPKMVRQI